MNDFFDFINATTPSTEAPQPQGDISCLAVRVDGDCFVFVDGEYHCDISAGSTTEIKLANGQYIIEFVSQEMEDIRFERIVEIDDKRQLLQVNEFQLALNRAKFVPELKVDQKTIKFKCSDDTPQTIDVIANCDWTASCKESWIILSESKGRAGHTSLEVKVKENPATKSRKATIIIKSNEYNLSSVVEVSQGAFEAYIKLSDNDISFPAKGGTKHITVTANCDWEVDINDAVHVGMKRGRGTMCVSPLRGGRGVTQIMVVALSCDTIQETSFSFYFENKKYKVRKELSCSQDGVYRPDIPSWYDLDIRQWDENKAKIMEELEYNFDEDEFHNALYRWLIKSR